MSRITTILLSGVLMLSLSACSYIFYPRADDYANQAKGATELDTVINLTTMMEASAKAARNGKGKDAPLDDLHNQFHAMDGHICCLTDEQKAKPAYDLAVTQNKELWEIFMRVWKFKDDQPQRADHLDLFAKHVQDLRATLQSLK
jgi:hypothetical protein